VVLTPSKTMERKSIDILLAVCGIILFLARMVITNEITQLRIANIFQL
jgi:hypothetical protein